MTSGSRGPVRVTIASQATQSATYGSFYVFTVRPEARTADARRDAVEPGRARDGSLPVSSAI